MELKKCLLTGYDINEFIESGSNPLITAYESDYSGVVHMAHATYLSLSQNSEPNWVVAGINLHNTLDRKEQLLINSDFLLNGFKNYTIPKEFEEKCYLTLKGLYLLIGKENRTIDQGIGKYSALGYTNYEEFTRILEQLISDHYIACKKKHRISGGRYIYLGISVTNIGKREARKMLPKVPMINLVDNSLSTGNSDIDTKINYAKDLFFNEPQSMENMRSACEQLSFVLEPLREELKFYFTSKDISDFFQIVNSFDIRHNRESTKKLEYVEQLDWIFYTLLNSINTYYKLHQKLNSSS